MYRIVAFVEIPTPCAHIVPASGSVVINNDDSPTSP